MGASHGVKVLFSVFSPFLAVLLLFLAMYHCRNLSSRRRRRPLEKAHGGAASGEEEEETEELITFPGGESLTVHSILDAPGEVVGKSNHSTLYKALVSRERNSSLMLLRFLRPASASRKNEILPAAQLLGLLRHPNLAPLHALYVGPRGEELLILPFYSAGSLHFFLKEASEESYDWELILRVSTGIANGLHHLHNGLAKPVIHGNLKSKNILLDLGFLPRLSDFGLHLLLNSGSAQEMLEASAADGYKSPELLKMKDASRESDIFSLGVIFLEMVTRRDPLLSSGSSAWSKEMICPQILSRCEEQEKLLSFFRLGISCCSPSPLLRPTIKDVLKKLLELRCTRK